MRCEHETYVCVRPIIVSLDVIKVGGGLESVVLPIQPTQPAKHNTSEQEKRRGMIGIRDLQMDVRIAATNSSNVALEMADIDGIESYLDKKKLVLDTRSERKETQS